MPDDLELLDVLAVALAPEPREPSLAELDALREIVDGAFRPRLVWLRRPMTAAAAAVIVVAGALVAGNTVLPRPARVVVRALDMPVDSVALADAKGRLEDLQEAVDARDPAAATTAVPAARSAVAKLDPADRRRVEPRATDLIDRGDELVASTSTTAPAAAPAPTSTTMPATTTSTSARPKPTSTTTSSTTSTTVRTSNEGPGSVNSGDGGTSGSDGGTSSSDSGA